MRLHCYHAGNGILGAAVRCDGNGVTDSRACNVRCVREPSRKRPCLLRTSREFLQIGGREFRPIAVDWSELRTLRLPFLGSCLRCRHAVSAAGRGREAAPWPAHGAATCAGERAREVLPRLAVRRAETRLPRRAGRVQGATCLCTACEGMGRGAHGSRAAHHPSCITLMGAHPSHY